MSRMNRPLTEQDTTNVLIREAIDELKKIDDLDCTDEVYESIEVVIQDLEACL